MSKQYVIAIDNLGRTIFGERLDTATPGTLVVNTPVIIHFAPAVDPVTNKQRPGQFQTQLIPLVFPQLLNGTAQWTYTLDTLNGYSFVNPTDSLVNMYESVIVAQPAPVQQTHVTQPREVKLFDDEPTV